jgi:diguanylate cyclase (GGDEF)-like protein
LGAQEYLSKRHVIGHLIARVIRHSIARQLQLQNAQTQALTDALTGIGNRRAFDMELSRRLNEFRRYGSGCCVLLLDLDHFKSVNDRFGHDVGDEVLQGVAGLLRETLRDTDLAARYGGEEFGVILPRTPVRVGYTVTERLRQNVARAKWKQLHNELQVTTSAGLAEAHPDDDECSLLRRVDRSLYAAKASGRNRCCWHDGDAPRCRCDGNSSHAHDSLLMPEHSYPVRWT